MCISYTIISRYINICIKNKFVFKHLPNLGSTRNSSDLKFRNIKQGGSPISLKTQYLLFLDTI